MQLSKLWLLVAAFLTWCFVAPATASDLVANFDSFPEGPIGFEFTDGGITFSDLDVALSGGPFRFIIEERSFLPWPHETPPNVLTSTGYSPGPAGGGSRFRSMTITFPLANSASMDAFIFDTDSNNKVLTVSALLDDVSVATKSVNLLQGTPIPTAHIYHRLSIDAPSFNKLTLLTTTPVGTPDFAFIAFDNVQIHEIPESRSLLLLLVGVLCLIPSCRCR